jgi:hypothetical protein
MNRLLTSPLSKQKQAPLSVLSTHQSTFFPLVMRDASERSSSVAGQPPERSNNQLCSSFYSPITAAARQGWVRGLIIPAGPSRACCITNKCGFGFNRPVRAWLLFFPGAVAPAQHALSGTRQTETGIRS